MTSTLLYRAEWPILEEARDTIPLRDLKDEARRELVVMLHEANVTPVGKPKITVSADRRSLLAIVTCTPRPGAVVCEAAEP